MISGRRKTYAVNVKATYENAFQIALRPGSTLFSVQFFVCFFNSGDFVIAEFASVVYMYQCCKGNRCARKEIHKTFMTGVGLEPKQI